MKKRLISALTVFILMLILSGYTWKEYTRYEPRSPEFVVELGDKLEKDPAAYLQANEEALEETCLDFSEVNKDCIGEYEVVAKFGDKEARFKVVVKDTVAPKVELIQEEYKGVAGKEILAKDLIKKVEDKAGIQSVSFKENQIEVDSKSEDLISRIGLKYEKPGEYTALFIVMDKSGLTTEIEIPIKVVEDYLAHVTGIQNITVEQGSSIDWLNGIEKDDKILSIEADASEVDLNNAGEYTLTYVITGDDGETVVEKEVKVTVVTPAEAQELANNGSTVKTTGGTKQKQVTVLKSSGSSGKKNSSSGNSSGSSSKGSSSGSSSNRNPGQSWEGDKTGEGYIDGGSEESGGNTYEEGTWNPWG